MVKEFTLNVIMMSVVLRRVVAPVLEEKTRDAAKSFSFSSGLYYKTSIFVIYNRNDSGLCYKTTILRIYDSS
jgi:hypothetical protein